VQQTNYISCAQRSKIKAKEDVSNFSKLGEKMSRFCGGIAVMLEMLQHHGAPPPKNCDFL
jgi:hypothetical protein